jgi:hypothetical protein
MLSFVLGVLAGGVAGFYCHDEISGYLSRQMPSLRQQLANRVRTVEEATSDGLVRLRTAISTTLRNAEESLRSTNGTSAASGVGVVAETEPS